MKLKYIFLSTLFPGLLFLFSAKVFTQERDNQTSMSYKQLVEEINKSQERRIEFHSVRFEFRGDAEDSIYMERVKNQDGITVWYQRVKGIHANSSVVFFDCIFEDRNIGFDHCEFLNFEFVGCDLPRYLTFHNCHLKGNLYFGDCGTDQQNLTVDQCVLNRSIGLLSQSFFNSVSLTGNTFEKDPLPYSQLWIKYNDFWVFGAKLTLPVYIHQSQVESLNMDDNVLADAENDTTFFLRISDSDFNDFNFSKSRVNSVGIINSSFRNQFRFDSVEIKHNILLSFVDFPPVHTNVSWKYLQGNKLGILSDDVIYKADRDEQLENSATFSDLISLYKNFHEIYKMRGDRQSANGCYVEMKDLETAGLAYNHKQHPARYSWVNWKLNQFLDLFCDYGTNPIKALFIALWTILGFAVLYFFFYDDWDGINRSFLVRQHRKMIEYFRSEKKLMEFHLEQYEEPINRYREYRSELENSKTEIPHFLRLLGKPLFQLLLVRYYVLRWLYKKIEILGGAWKDLKPMRKILIGTVTGPAILFYLFYLAFIRGLNSLVLSVNSFSTLGFGDIPVRRFMRYVAILEGFLGWFLLSIFSVSLISQILQSL